jgi:hypothetical protein|tara:strand:+ start:339 stop:662 length:324 start_codon:yes stop_codon:yes gene_type:complete
MIGAIFQFGGDHVEVIVNGNSIYFREAGGAQSTIDGLKLSKAGVEKEFPDLKNDLNWRKKAIQRFKDNVRAFKTEKESMDYIIDDLKKYGYQAKFIQMSGFRPQKIS